jgi:hypothetical protein
VKPAKPGAHADLYGRNVYWAARVASVISIDGIFSVDNHGQHSGELASIVGAKLLFKCEPSQPPMLSYV